MYNGSTRLLDQFIAHISVERGLARATVRAYESDLRRYLSWLAHTRGITDPDAIGKADIEEYVAQLDSDGDSARRGGLPASTSSTGSPSRSTP